ncbi:chitin binding domain- and peptidoglycan binding domain-containing protein [Penicillium oxalicum 114-2]|uniref:Chitin binding domain-and peptidoglycan binding domain-containing protein n=1 Tax=Penicillium oxalicum (strain 114-2 / CGMCC 5302) TaxID=933388 RepID=S7ZEY8_PENO1|nr:chitin binding domain- and peptidoglycan binding domain-containing protein [Penicillium oxalicum 114-2]
MSGITVAHLLSSIFCFFLLSPLAAASEAPTLVARDDGPICSTYIVAGGDTCAKIAQAHGITEKNIEDFNARTWAWRGCGELEQGAFICVAAGEPPMPVALPQATCGPQVPGTVRPHKYSDLGGMNPCPNKQCCGRWGTCGTTAEFCSSANHCISNCNKQAGTQPATPPPAITEKPKAPPPPPPPPPPSAKSAESTKTTHPPTKTTTHSTKTTKSVSLRTSTSTKWVTVTAKPPEPSHPHWELTLYSEQDCQGDYYLVKGSSTRLDKCFTLHSHMQSQDSEADFYCRWYYDGGFNWTSCDNSPMKRPTSWFLNIGACTVYPDDHCEPDTDFGSLQCESGT